MEAVKGSQIDRCGYTLSGLPRKPPGVRAPLQLHHRRLGQHSPVHSSAVVGDPWRPDSHLPTPVPPPPFPTGGVGEQCSPQGPVSPEVTKAQRAHRELRSLECSWGREVLSTPQDLPSTVCSATCDPLGQSRSVTGHMPRAPLWGSVVGWRKPQVTRPTDSPSSLSVGLPCPAAGARSTGHTHPPPTR